MSDSSQSGPERKMSLSLARCYARIDIGPCSVQMMLNVP